VTVVDGLKAAALIFVAAILQVSVFSQARVFGGAPDLLLVTLVAVGLLRGSLFGAAGGFFGGLLVDTATLAKLGLTSLVLTLAGYWIGRYGETTGRDRAHAPFLSIAVITVLYDFGVLIIHFVIGEPAPGAALVRGLLPSLIANLILTAPVYWFVRRLLRPLDRGDYATEVQLLG
jgi:rod shape-determining protein MreD